MKKIKCPICGSENREGMKYCRICFSRLTTSPYSISLKTNFYSKVVRHKSILTIILIFLLFFIIWILIK
ncbi:MAG: hypothetical protein N2643_05630 [Endomicrobia bacterium]|nr:hypothetical protein [Endomicrobiia bacterium]